jgi:hypothetical protein
VSIRWIRVLADSRCISEARNECWYVFSIESKSLTVLPRSTLPATAIAPCLRQQRLGERRLARRPIPHQPYSTNVLRRELRHGGFPKSG